MMLIAVMNSVILPETRRLFQLFPKPVQKLWNSWELRALVILSLILQVSLFHFGRHRRYSVRIWINIFLWVCYLVADSVATFALGIISSKQGNSCSQYGNDAQVQDELIAFWAPFMLLHLGGQDTITAYAIQDNELWLRHMLGLVVQSGVALYILLITWKSNWLSFLTIPILLAGFIKYAERTWMMRSANRNPKFIIAENFKGLLFDAHMNFQRFRPMFLNQKIVKKRVPTKIPEELGFGTDLTEHFERLPFEMAFKMIEIELGLAYDVFYTKTPLFSTAWGYIFRCITFSSTVFVFVFFVVHERHKHKHQQVDLIITYILLVGAIFIEIYAVILLIASNVERRRLNSLFPSRQIILREKKSGKQRWSNSMGQFNMLNFCIRNRPGGNPKFFVNLRQWFFSRILPKLNIELEMFFYMTNKQVSDELKSLFWDIFKEKSNLYGPGFSEDYNSYLCRDKSVHVEIYEKIIIWYVATEFCLDEAKKDDDNLGNPTEKGDTNNRKKAIKEISEYMMYILASCPFLLSAGNAKITFETSCEKVSKYLKNYTGSSTSAFEKLSSCRPTENEGGQTELVKNYLSQTDLLQCAFLVVENLRREEKMWEILTRFWVENLAYVATLCQGNNHAQQLCKGGEFLTHLWFLIEHLDLKEIFRMPPKRPQAEDQIPFFWLNEAEQIPV